MNCVTFSRAFRDNMSALGLPAPNSLFSSLTTALANLGAMLNAFKSVGPSATVAEMIGATVLKEKLDVIGVMAASYYVGAVIGSVIVATESARACKDPYRNTPIAGYRAALRFIASRGMIIPIDFEIFIQRNPEVIADSPRRKSYALRARQYGAKQ
jgi:hypothetical protein